MVCVAILPLAIYLYVDFFALTDRIKLHGFMYFQEVSENVSRSLQNFLNDRQTDLLLLSENPIITSDFASDDVKLYEMSKVQEYYQYFDDITLLDSDGAVIISTTYSFYSEISATSWFKKTLEGRAVISTPYLSSDGKRLYITFFVPLFNEGTVESVIVARMDMKKIWEMTSEVNVGDRGYVVLLDSHGRIIAHPNRDRIFDVFEDLEVDKYINGTLTNTSFSFYDEADVHQIGFVSLFDDENKNLADPFLIVIVQPKDEVYSLINYVIIRDLLQLVAVTSIIILVSLFLSGRITQPIETIIDGAGRLSQGEMGVSISVRSWEEIESIADAFNRMSQSLLEYTDKIKNSEQKYRTLVEDIDEGYFLLDHGRIHYANEAALQLLGFPREEAMGKHITDFFPKDMHDRILKEYTNLLSTPEFDKSIEMPVRKKTGEHLFLEFRPKLISEPEKEIVAGLFIDVSARKIREKMLEEYRNFLEMKVKEKTKELRESEEKYQMLFENANEAILIIQDGQVRFMNPRAVELTGFSKEELILIPFDEIVHQQDREKVQEQFHRLLSGEDIKESLTYRIITKGGEIKWVDVISAHITWEDTPATLDFFSDVTDRVQAEEALRASEEKYRNLFETSKDVIYFSTVDGRILDINFAAEELLGYTRDELLSLPADDLYIDADEREKFQNEIERKGFLVDYELIMKKKDGTFIDCIEAATVIKDSSGKVTGYHGILKDITQRKKMETDIINAKNRFQAAFDAVDSRMYMITEQYQLFYVNRSIKEELGLEYTDILGKTCYSFFNSENAPCTGCPVADVIVHGEPTGGEVVVDIEKSRLFLSVNVYPVQTKEKKYDYLIYSTDITEQKKIQEHLIQSDRLISLGQLSAGVAHEINNPLTAILGYSQILLQDVESDSEQEEGLEIIKSQAENCKVILDDLLVFSRARPNKKDYFSINDVVRGVIPLVKKDMKDKRISLDLSLEDYIPPYFGDQIKITQVFLNLLNNAVYAVDTGGSIRIDTKWRDMDKCISVSFVDNGPGIREEDKKHIFDPFFSTKPQGKGTGLGLSVSYGIVSEHGGEISVESQPGKETVFIITLPVMETDLH
ncbi:MAG: PAS domain S-box protein [Deltaproteobacteria bacterium]|nr:PAS domain S-box protein [Candidatus Zymogenaceae bacterium]